MKKKNVRSKSKRLKMVTTENVELKHNKRIVASWVFQKFKHGIVLEKGDLVKICMNHEHFWACIGGIQDGVLWGLVKNDLYMEENQDIKYNDKIRFTNEDIEEVAEKLQIARSFNHFQELNLVPLNNRQVKNLVELGFQNGSCWIMNNEIIRWNIHNVA